MKTKPRNYRNNNKSETIAPSKVAKPIIGKFVKDSKGNETFIETKQ